MENKTIMSLVIFLQIASLHSMDLSNPNLQKIGQQKLKPISPQNSFESTDSNSSSSYSDFSSLEEFPFPYQPATPYDGQNRQTREIEFVEDRGGYARDQSQQLYLFANKSEANKIDYYCPDKGINKSVCINRVVFKKAEQENTKWQWGLKVPSSATPVVEQFKNQKMQFIELTLDPSSMAPSIIDINEEKNYSASVDPDNNNQGHPAKKKLVIPLPEYAKKFYIFIDNDYERTNYQSASNDTRTYLNNEYMCKAADVFSPSDIYEFSSSSLKADSPFKYKDEFGEKTFSEVIQYRKLSTATWLFGFKIPACRLWNPEKFVKNDYPGISHLLVYVDSANQNKMKRFVVLRFEQKS